MHVPFKAIFSVLLVFAFLGCSIQRPLIIAHRGASGYRPEHTLEGYALAIEMGADFVEPDLVPTKDGVLICRHENNLTETTDVAQKFPKRKKIKSIDGKKVSGWFSEDFTLNEIKQLRAKERLANRDQSYNGLFQIPTFDELIALVKNKRNQGYHVGIYPEIKHPTYFATLGIDVTNLLITALEKNKLSLNPDEVIIQSFEPSCLKRLASIGSPYRRIQLIGEKDEIPFDQYREGNTETFSQMISSKSGLKEIASYAYGIGPNKEYIFTLTPDGIFHKVSSLIEDAHDQGLVVHSWTFRTEDVSNVSTISFNDEVKVHLNAGTDGIFTDYTDLAIFSQRKE